MIELGLEVRGLRELREGLAALDPARNPRGRTRALLAGAELLRRGIRANLAGPRPRRLDEVTGELRASVGIDPEVPTEARIGVPASLFWYEFHELGLGRFPKRPAVLEAIESALDELESAFAFWWEAQATREGGR